MIQFLAHVLSDQGLKLCLHNHSQTTFDESGENGYDRQMQSVQHARHATHNQTQPARVLAGGWEKLV